MKEKNEFFNKILFKKYKIQKAISPSLINFLYEGINIITKAKVAIKIENQMSGKDTLTNESYMLFNLKGYGIPEIISFGHKGKYNVLIEELLGKSLQDLFELNDNEIPLKDICMIAIQLIERLEYIHSKFIIHRSINPTNFVIGEKDSSLIYAIDFGYAKKYRSSRTGKHLKFNLNNRIFGDPSFISINAMRGIEQSRRDDMESLGYMLIYLLRGFLPWKEFENKSDKLKKIYYLKKKIPLSRLCKYVPEEIRIYMDHCKNLTFEQAPSYEYLRGLFIQILAKFQKINDNIFFWNKSKKEEKNNNKKDLFVRKENNSKRLYRKIHTSLNKTNNNIFFDTYCDRLNFSINNQFNNIAENQKFETNLNQSKTKKYNSSKNRQIIIDKDLFKNHNFIYKKKNNINSIINIPIKFKKKNYNFNDNKNKDMNKVLKIINYNTFRNFDLIKLNEYPKIANLGENGENNESMKEKYKDKSDDNLNIIEIKSYDKYKNKRINFKVKKNNSYNNFNSKCNIYKKNYNNIKRTTNSNINYNNQNYIDNINIIGNLKELKDLNKEQMNNNFLNRNIYSSIQNNINKNFNIKFNDNSNTSKNYNERNSNQNSYQSIFHKRNKTNFINLDFYDNNNLNNIFGYSPIKETKIELLNKSTKKIKQKPILENNLEKYKNPVNINNIYSNEKDNKLYYFLHNNSTLKYNI